MEASEVSAIRSAIDNLTSLIEGEGTPVRPGVMGVMQKNSDRLERHDERLMRVERTLDRIKWTVIGWAAAGATAGGGITAVMLEVWRASG